MQLGKVRIKRITGTFEARIVEIIRFGGDYAGFRAVVTNSTIKGYRNGETIECGTLTEYTYI